MQSKDSQAMSGLGKCVVLDNVLINLSLSQPAELSMLMY